VYIVNFPFAACMNAPIFLLPSSLSSSEVGQALGAMRRTNLELDRGTTWAPATPALMAAAEHAHQDHCKSMIRNVSAKPRPAARPWPRRSRASSANSPPSQAPPDAARTASPMASCRGHHQACARTPTLARRRTSSYRHCRSPRCGQP
jgi:hypothetical protein